MKYEAKSFSLPASAGSAAYCAEHGHTMPDVRGKCVRCGNRVRLADVIDSWPENVAVIDLPAPVWENDHPRCAK